MDSIVYFYASGGPFMHGVLGGCMCAGLGALAGGIAYGWKRWAGMLIFVLLSSVPFCSGLAGMIQGMVLTHRAVAYASPESAQELIDQGNAVSMYPVYLAGGELCICLGTFIVLAMISGWYFRRRRFQQLMAEE